MKLESLRSSFEKHTKQLRTVDTIRNFAETSGNVEKLRNFRLSADQGGFLKCAQGVL